MNQRSQPRRTRISYREHIRREEEEYITLAERTRLIDEIGMHWRRGQTFWLLTHEAPDGDALGCNLALMSALRDMGKDVTLLSYDALPRMYRFLPNAEHVLLTVDLPKQLPDVIHVNDTAAFDRLGIGFAKQLTERGVGPMAREPNPDCVMLNVDHHIGNSLFADVNLVDPSCGACGELLYHMFTQLDIPITKEIAVNLYAAVMTDTGRFSYGNTDSETFSVTTQLIRAGADPYDVANRVYHTRTVDQMRLMAKVIDTINVRPELGYFTVTCTQQMLHDTNTVTSDTEGVADLIKTVVGFEMAFFLKEEREGTVKVSLRSDGNVDVRKFAQRLGGGGHPAASGFRMYVPIEEAEEALAEQVSAYINEMAPLAVSGIPGQRER